MLSAALLNIVDSELYGGDGRSTLAIVLVANPRSVPCRCQPCGHPATGILIKNFRLQIAVGFFWARDSVSPEDVAGVRD